jgi:hypothetical protein
MRKIISYVHRDPRKLELLKHKEALEREIAMWQERIIVTEAILENSEIGQNIRNILTEISNLQVRCPTLISNFNNTDTNYYYNFILSHIDYRLNSDIDTLRITARSTHQVNTDRLARAIEELSTYTDISEQEITVKAIRDAYKSLSYIKNGTVNLYEASNNFKYVSFTLHNTYVTTYESWDESIKSGLLRSSYASVSPLNDHPSFLLPPLRITVGLTNKDINVKRATSNNKIRFGLNNSAHPHSPGSRNACLGTFRNAYCQAIDNFDFIGIASIVRLWAQVAVLSDGWGRSFLNGFDHVLKTVLNNPQARVIYHTIDSLTYDGKPLYFEEYAPGAYKVRIGEDSYDYNPNEL